MIDLEALKDKIDAATLATLKAGVDALTSRAETAESKARKAAQESIEGRKTLKAERDAAFAKLGVDSADEIDNLPDAKGQAEAAKQFDTQLKKLQRELGDKAKALDEITGKYSTERRERAIAEQVGKHPFIDADDVRALVSARVKQEGDELTFTGPDGKVVPLADGVAWFAKTKTHLVRAAGDGSQGSGFKGNKPDAGTKTMTRSAFDVLPAAEKFAVVRDRTTITED